MFTAISTALSALSANASAVSIVGNNLANLNTTGYKTDAFQFHDLVGQVLSSAGSDIGIGVAGVQSVRQFSQGSIQQTTSDTDAAISGEGFFVVKDQQNKTLFTRAGNFSIDATGHLQTSTGEFVQGWNATGGVVDTNSAVSSLVLPINGVIAAVPTTKLSLTANLNAAGVVAGTDGVYSAPVQVVDSLGGTHTLTVTFTKTDVNKWTYDVTIPDADLTTPSATPLATGSLTFDGTGVLTAPVATDPPIDVPIAGLKDGAADLAIKWSLFTAGGTGLIDQFAQTSGVSSVFQDGVQAGQIVKVGITDGGTIVGRYSNGQQITVGQVALAAIQNPTSLISAGNNNLQATADTAEPAIGTADSGGRGTIKGHSLEGSTVDIAAEFTNLITLQRSYQANSRVITTSDEMLQETVGLKR